MIARSLRRYVLPLVLIASFLHAQPQYLVWKGPTIGAVNGRSADSIAVALQSLGGTAVVTTDLFLFGSDLSRFEGIFVVLGIYPNNHVLVRNGSEAPALEQYLLDGGRLYVEGGNCFGIDPWIGGYDINPWFGMDIADNGPFEPSLTGIDGLTYFDGLAIAYSGEDNSMDELQPRDGTPIWENDVIEAIAGVVYGGFGAGRSIAVVPGFGFLSAPGVSRDSLMARYLDLFQRVDPPEVRVTPGALNAIVQSGERRILPLTLANTGGWLSDTLRFTTEVGDATPWLQAAPPAGAVRFGAPIGISAVVDAANLPPGTYSGIVKILSNDPVSSVVEVDVAITVVPPTAISLRQDSLAVALLADSVAERRLTIVNSGASELRATVEVDRRTDAGASPPPMESLDVLRQRRAAASFATSLGRAPQRAAGGKRAALPENAAGGGPVIAHSIDQDFSNPYRVVFDVDAPAILERRNLDPTLGLFDVAGTFPVAPDRGVYYLIDVNDDFYRVDTTSGAATRLSTLTTATSFIWTGLTADPRDGTLYATVTDVLTSELHRIDPHTGSNTRIGEIGFEAPIALAMDGSGTLYALDIITDFLIVIDPETGEGEPVGPVGFDANFAQGMAWDPATDRLLLAAFNDTQGRAEVRVADRTTGLTRLIAPIGIAGRTQISFLAIPGGIGIGTWLNLNTTEVVLAPGDSVVIRVTFDAGNLVEGTYPADLRIRSNDLRRPDLSVATRLTVRGRPDLVADPGRVDFGTVDLGDTARVSLRLRNAGSALLTVDAIDVAGDGFGVDGEDLFSLAPGQSRVIGVAFAPATVDSGQGRLVARTGDGDSLVVDLVGEGIHPAVLEGLPATLEVTLAPGDTALRYVDIRHGGQGPVRDLEWRAVLGGPVATRQPARSAPGTVAPASPAPSAPQTPSAGPPVGTPAVERPAPYAGRPLVLAEVGGHSIEQELDVRTRIDVDAPQLFPTLGADPSSGFDNAGDFGPNDQSFYYLLDWDNGFYTVDTLTGQATLRGRIAPRVAGHEWMAMAVNPINGDIFVVSADLRRADLYTLDPVTATVDSVGRLFAIPGLVGMAFDGFGRLFAMDILAQSLFEIDPRTAEAVEIGSLGYVSNFGQGMAWDPNRGRMLVSAFEAGFFQGEMREVDLDTGGTTFLGIIGGGDPRRNYYQLAFLAIPDQRRRFIRLPETARGTLSEGMTTRIPVRLAPPTAADTTWEATITVTSNDPLRPRVRIPVRVTVDARVGIAGREALPETVTLAQNYPNPFNPSTAIGFALPGDGEVRLRVFDVLGRPVRTLVAGRRPAGTHEVVWDGRDDGGAEVAGGVYVYRLEVRAGGSAPVRRTGKMVLLR